LLYNIVASLCSDKMAKKSRLGMIPVKLQYMYCSLRTCALAPNLWRLGLLKGLQYYVK